MKVVFYLLNSPLLSDNCEQAQNVCVSVFMQITYGTSTDGPKYCGSTIPKLFRFITDRVRLEFVSDDSVTFKGFRIDYTFELAPETGD